MINQRAKSKKIHFMGIGGSGMSAVALLALEAGFAVEGSDLQSDTPYLTKVKNAGIKTYVGHTTNMLDGVDILAVTPAVFFNAKNEMVDEAKARNIPIVTWQEFMGRFLHTGKRVIAVAGTHGKSTTTTMLGLVYEQAGKDPTVEVGATVREWNSNYRLGKSAIFVSEADEFYGNFLHYHPEIVILTNIEFDHPDYFTSETHLFETFQAFIKNMTGEKLLIINQDNVGIGKLLDKLDIETLESLKIIGFTLSNAPHISVPNSVQAIDIVRTPEATTFTVNGTGNSLRHSFTLALTGDHNISNALGVIALGLHEEIEPSVIEQVLSRFEGSGRRMELVGTKGGVSIYDDYAHHPTAIKATLSGLRQRYPTKKIICVVEPHSFSRTKALLPLYKNAFKDADRTIVTPIYPARDKSNFGVTSQSIVDRSGHKNSAAADTYDEVVQMLRGVSGDSVIIVMGAGKSYQLARDVYAKIRNA